MVKCSECGFLSIRDHDGKYLEVDDDYRALGQLTGSYMPTLGNRPICFVNAWPLSKEIEQESRQQPIDYESCVRKTITKERTCPRIKDENALGFRKWQRGSTPKEHREMLDRERMLKWQAEREDADRTWRAEQANDNRKLRLSEVNQLKWSVRLAAGAIVFGVLATVLAGLIEAGILYPQKQRIIFENPTQLQPPSATQSVPDSNVP